MCCTCTPSNCMCPCARSCIMKAWFSAAHISCPRKNGHMCIAKKFLRLILLLWNWQCVFVAQRYWLLREARIWEGNAGTWLFHFLFGSNLQVSIYAYMMSKTWEVKVMLDHNYAHIRSGCPEMSQRRKWHEQFFQFWLSICCGGQYVELYVRTPNTQRGVAAYVLCEERERSSECMCKYPLTRWSWQLRYGSGNSWQVDLEARIEAERLASLRSK